MSWAAREEVYQTRDDPFKIDGATGLNAFELAANQCTRNIVDFLRKKFKTRCTEFMKAFSTTYHTQQQQSHGMYDCTAAQDKLYANLKYGDACTDDFQLITDPFSATYIGIAVGGAFLFCCLASIISYNVYSRIKYIKLSMPGLARALRESDAAALERAKLWMGEYAVGLNQSRLSILQDAASDGERKLASGLNQEYIKGIGTGVDGWKELSNLPSKSNSRSQLDYVSAKFVEAVKRGEGTPGQLMVELADRQDFSGQYKRYLEHIVASCSESEGPGNAFDIKTGPLKLMQRIEPKSVEYFEENVETTGELRKGVSKRFLRLNHELTRLLGTPEGRSHALTPARCEFAILDFVRCAITCENPAALTRLFRSIRRQPGVLGYKNGFDFKTPAPPSNYRDFKFLLAVPFACANTTEREALLDDGEKTFYMIVELQLMLPTWRDIKKINSIHYKVRRAIDGASLQRDCSKYVERAQEISGEGVTVPKLFKIDSETFEESTCGQKETTRGAESDVETGEVEGYDALIRRADTFIRTQGEEPEVFNLHRGRASSDENQEKRKSDRATNTPFGRISVLQMTALQEFSEEVK